VKPGATGIFREFLSDRDEHGRFSWAVRGILIVERGTPPVGFQPPQASTLLSDTVAGALPETDIAKVLAVQVGRDAL